MRVWVMVLTAVLAVSLGSLGCGGSDKKGPEEPEVEEPEVEEPEDDTLLSQEQLDTVEAFLARQRKFVARCWVKAIDAQEVPARDSGKISISFQIGASGSVTEAHVTKTSHKSEALESCVLGKASRWKISGMEQAMEYSYTFGFQRL